MPHDNANLTIHIVFVSGFLGKIQNNDPHDNTQRTNRQARALAYAVQYPVPIVRITSYRSYARTPYRSYARTPYRSYARTPYRSYAVPRTDRTPYPVPIVRRTPYRSYARTPHRSYACTPYRSYAVARTDRTRVRCTGRTSVHPSKHHPERGQLQRLRSPLFQHICSSARAVLTRWTDVLAHLS